VKRGMKNIFTHHESGTLRWSQGRYKVLHRNDSSTWGGTNSVRQRERKGEEEVRCGKENSHNNIEDIDGGQQYSTADMANTK